MRADLPGSPSILAGVAGLALGALAGLTGGLFGLTGPVPALLFGLVAATEAIELERSRDLRDLRNVTIGALTGGAAGVVAMGLAHEPLAHALPLAANYLLMGALAGAWFRRARVATALGALFGALLGAGLAITTGRLLIGHAGTDITGLLAVALQLALGSITGAMVGAWIGRAGSRTRIAEESPAQDRPDPATIELDETQNSTSPDHLSRSAGSDSGRL